MTSRKHWTAALVFAALAIFMTWPLLPNVGRAVAYPGDPYINTWILDWDWHATFHQPGHLFQANIFYPAKYSLAFSENLYGIAIVLFPLRALGVTPLAAYNVAMLLGYAMCGFFAYLLAIEVTGNVAGALAAGVFYAFVPYRFTHLSHVQYVWAGTLPLLLLTLVRYARVPDWSHAAAFSLAFLWNGLSNVHFFFFGSIAVVMTALLLRPPLRRIALTGTVALLLLAPFLYPYQQASKLYGMERSWEEALDHSANPGDWLVDNFAHRPYPTHSDPKVDPERWLFPGALVLFLALVSLASRNWKPLMLAWSWTLLGFIGSLGLHTPFYRFLFNYVPGFHAMRVPARWALITHVGLALAIAISVAWMSRRAGWVGAVAAVAFIAELRGPIRWYMAPSSVRPVDRWAAAARPHAMVELPMSDQNDEYGVMLNATAHHRPIVNGVSGFAPPEYLKLVSLAQPWSDDLVPELARIGVTHVVIRAVGLDAAGRAWLERMVDRGKLGLIRRFDDGAWGDWLFRINARGDSADLRSMLAGHVTFNDATFGALAMPTGHESLKGRVTFSGVALSPFGVRAVNLLFDGGTVRYPAAMHADPAASRWYRWYDATTKPAFTRTFDARPSDVRLLTDVQVEIIDGRGERTLLDDRWIDWN